MLSKKLRSKNKFGPNNFIPKTFLVQKNYGLKKFLLTKIFFVQTNFWVEKNSPPIFFNFLDSDFKAWWSLILKTKSCNIYFTKYIITN